MIIAPGDGRAVIRVYFRGKLEFMCVKFFLLNLRLPASSDTPEVLKETRGMETTAHKKNFKFFITCQHQSIFIEFLETGETFAYFFARLEGKSFEKFQVFVLLCEMKTHA